ncbi:hypothetical protein FQN50_003439 [Emmonsiellopsis sp. PD_5]|nr:hypothetical protein FQN50_003439 [Emmonsiellopsis sp. PD_5]
MASTRFDEVEKLAGTVNVFMNTVGFIVFGQNQKYCLVTSDLNGCSAVAIVSQHAAILAHIPPRPSLDSSNLLAGDQNMQAKMNEVAYLLTQHRILFEGNHAWVVYAVLGDEIGLADQKAIIDRTLEGLCINYTNYPYPVSQDENRPPGHGTIVVDARSGVPQVYIDDSRVK